MTALATSAPAADSSTVRPSPAGAASAGARLALAVLGGAAQLAAFPPLGWWWAAPLGVAALLLAVRGADYRTSFAAASLAGLVLFVPLLEWVRFLGPGPWLLLAVVQAAIVGLLGPVLVLLSRRPTSALLLAAATVGAFVAVEALRARQPFGGLTWGRLAFGQSDGPLLPLAAVGGAPLVSAAVVVVGIGLLGLRSRKRRSVVLAGLAVAGPFLAAGAVPMPVDGARVQVAAVQGNVPGQGLDAFSEDLVVLDNHVRQTRRLAAEVAAGRRARPDLVIWPENASDQDPRSEPQSRARVEAAVEALGQPLLLGAVLREEGRTVNGLLAYGPTGQLGPSYAKRHLVPFGEYLPLRSIVERVYPNARRLLPGDFSPGQQVGLLELSGVPLAVGTCFEVAFDSLPREAVRAGGQLLVLPSNNASYGRSAQSDQQLAMARLRAVEHARSTVVATTSGISALIEPDGDVVARSSHYEPALLQAALPRRTELTLATRVGGAVEPTLALLVMLPWVAQWVRARRSRP